MEVWIATQSNLYLKLVITKILTSLAWMADRKIALATPDLKVMSTALQIRSCADVLSCAELAQNATHADHSSMHMTDYATQAI